MYEVLSRQQLLTVTDASEYRSILRSLNMVSFEQIPGNLQVRFLSPLAERSRVREHTFVSQARR
jgi:hypothetical protein